MATSPREWSGRITPEAAVCSMSTPVRAVTPASARKSRKRIVRPWEDVTTDSHPSTPPLSPPSPAYSTGSTSLPLDISGLVLQQHVALLHAISQLQAAAPDIDDWLSGFASCYLSRVLHLEAYRSQALRDCPLTSSTAVHHHYDAQRLAVLRQSQMDLQNYTRTRILAASRVATATTMLSAAARPTFDFRQSATTPPGTPHSYRLDTSYSSGSDVASSPDVTPPPPKHRRLAPTTTPIFTSRQGSSGRSRRAVANKRFLGAAAVEHLEDWYRRHQHRPYADAEQVRQLAAAGGISFTQVRKWLANRRLRTHNTRSNIRSRDNS